MSAGRTPVPRHRDRGGPALLTQGFRPFFLLAGLWAAAALPASFAALQGSVALPTALPLVSWHIHEMLFGFVSAAMAGFMLTAIPHWTGRLPLQGAPLLGLVLLWVAGRLAIAVSALIGPWAAALIDLAFLAALAAVVLREIVAGRHWRSGPVAAVVVLFLLSNALFHAEALDLAATGEFARRGAVAVVIALIALIGGRITPSFTRNWLAKRGAGRLPAGFGAFDRLCLLATVVALAGWVAAPASALAGAMAALAAALNLARLSRWCGLATLAEPLVWILHLGYLWIPLGLALLAASAWWPALPESSAVHALTTGAMGTMILAVMSRATLGHTGRALTAGPGLTAAYVLVSLAALARVASPLAGELAGALLVAATAAWTAAFVLYLCVCGPMLLTRARNAAPP